MPARHVVTPPGELVGKSIAADEVIFAGNKSAEEDG